MSATSKSRRWRRGRQGAKDLLRPDVPYVMNLPDGRRLFVEVPGRWTVEARGGQVGFTPQGVRFLDRLRALAWKLDRPPSPGYITSLREAIGVTQAEMGQRIGVNKLTISRWERGTLRPGAASIRALETLRQQAVRRGVALAG